MVDRPSGSTRHNAVACVVAAVAGASTLWLPEATVLILGVLALAALVLLFATPQARVAAVLAGSVVAATAVRLPEWRVEPVIQGIVFGLVTALVLAAPLTTRRALLQRREFQRRGWQLAATESRRRESETRRVLQRERMALAAEMHDGLGHSLTLIAVRLGQLSLLPSLSEEERKRVSEVRGIAADAADELGVAVGLLREAHDPAAGWERPTVAGAVAGARKAGMDVDASLEDGLDERLSDEVGTAVARVVQEGLTNASKHSPGQPVTVRVAADGDAVLAVVSNPRSDEPGDASGSGFGLDGLRHRAALLGGDVRVDESDTSFTLTLTVPRRARPSAVRGEETGTVVAAEDEAATARSRATRAAVALPAAIASALVFVAFGYFVISNTMSVMGADALSAIQVGQERSAVERALPGMDMLDPPTDDFPATPGEECRYFEDTVSFFERVDVHVVCFDGDRVSRTGTVPAP